MFNYLVSRYIVYFKLIQWINFEYNGPLNFLIKPFMKYLENFSNNAPYTEDDIDYNTLISLNKIEVNFKPINSGTISLVFLGTIRETGEEVAVKLLRNNIEDKIKNCLETMDYIFFIIKYIPYLNSLESDKYYDEIKNTFLEQIDFKKEVKNINLFRKSLKNCKECDTIKCYEDYCNNKVIVMNYVRGKTIYELNREEKKYCLEKYGKYIIFSIMLKKILHLDAHPGNIIFTNEPNYKICMIDLGMVLEIEDKECSFIRDFNSALESKRFENIIKVIEEHKETMFLNPEDGGHAFINFLKNEHKKGKIFQEFNLKHSTKDLYFMFNNIKNHKYQLNGTLRKVLLGIISNISLLLYFKSYDEKDVKNMTSST